LAPKRTITSTSLLSKPWSTLPPKEMGPQVQRLIEAFKREQSGRRVRYRRNLELYERRKWNDYSTYSDSTSEDFARDRLGLIRSAVATAVSSVYAPQKPKPQFQTSGATWAVRRRAYKLDRVCEGIINQRQGRWINVWAFMTEPQVKLRAKLSLPSALVGDTRVPRPLAVRFPAEHHDRKARRVPFA
jgi:hypothetical protein